jgi:ribose transport system substrate-binding protein
LRALQGQGRAGKVEMIGFDAGPLLIEALRAGTIDLLVIQNPFKMGYEGTKLCIAKLNGENVPKKIDTGVALLTKENIDTPEMQALMK